MKKTITATALLLAASAITGCAGSYDVDGVSMMQNRGNAFSSALQARYVERARFEVGEGDWSSVSFFNTRARMAADGEAVAPQDPAERNLKKDAPGIQQAHATLSSALAGGAAAVTPDACALAQTWLEHWMEQSEEGHQDNHIAMARAGHEKAMPMCAGTGPGSLVVYFSHNSSVIDRASLEKINQFAKTAMASGAKALAVQGHADLSGDGEYNNGLSRMRADAVGGALAGAGIGPDMLNRSHLGETMPAVKTADGVREGKNRRVVVTATW